MDMGHVNAGGGFLFFFGETIRQKGQLLGQYRDHNVRQLRPARHCRDIQKKNPPRARSIPAAASPSVGRNGHRDQSASPYEFPLQREVGEVVEAILGEKKGRSFRCDKKKHRSPRGSPPPHPLCHVAARNASGLNSLDREG